jgi:hypothetical protein
MEKIKKVRRIVGWSLSGILSLLFAFSASAFLKISQNPEAIAGAEAIGISAQSYLMIGIVELVSVLLFLIPRTSVVGALLLIAYMGGAIATNVQTDQPLLMVIIVEILIWIAAWLRNPELGYKLFKSA